MVEDMSTYKGWKKRILDYVETDDSLWKAIGLWLYPKYGVKRTQYNHLCEENFKRGTSNMESKDRCLGCGEEMLDGIKMIALLEQL